MSYAAVPLTINHPPQPRTLLSITTFPANEPPPHLSLCPSPHRRTNDCCRSVDHPETPQNPQKKDIETKPTKKNDAHPAPLTTKRSQISPRHVEHFFPPPSLSLLEAKPPPSSPMCPYKARFVWLYAISDGRHGAVLWFGCAAYKLLGSSLSPPSICPPRIRRAFIRLSPSSLYVCFAFEVCTHATVSDVCLFVREDLQFHFLLLFLAPLPPTSSLPPPSCRRMMVVCWFPRVGLRALGVAPAPTYFFASSSSCCW